MPRSGAPQSKSQPFRQRPLRRGHDNVTPRRRHVYVLCFLATVIGSFMYLNVVHAPKRKQMASSFVSETLHRFKASSSSSLSTTKAITSKIKTTNEPNAVSSSLSERIVIPDRRDDDAAIGGNCHPDTVRVWHRPGSKLARWTKEYFDWHYESRCAESPIPVNATKESGGGGVKYLVIQCLKAMNCGGTADRLQPLPAYIWHAYRMKRIILIQWERPHPLEEFLLPPLGGINWTTPQWILPHLSNFSMIRPQMMKLDALLLYENSTDTIITAKVQTYAHAILGRFDEIRLTDPLSSNPNPPYVTAFHHMFRAFFTPSPPVAALVSAVMKEHNLVPNQFVTAHIRARYPTNPLKNMLGRREHKRQDKQGGLPFQTNPDVKNYIIPVAVNAINCAGHIAPNTTIYVASDSDDVVNYLLHESEFVTAPRSLSNMTHVTLTSLSHAKEPLHLDMSDYESHPPAEFYSVFVDLWILGQARCTSYGMGGFGRFGMYMSYDASCSANHRNFNGKIQKCPSLLD